MTARRPHPGWTFLIVSVALLALFVVVELRSRAPLVPFRIFRLPNITGANVSALVGVAFESSNVV